MGKEEYQCLSGLGLLTGLREGAQAHVHSHLQVLGAQTAQKWERLIHVSSGVWVRWQKDGAWGVPACSSRVESLFMRNGWG